MSSPADASFGENAEQIKQYVDILLYRGIEWGLIGPREGDRLWERHILNSIAAEPLFAPGATVVDVGSGAGLPGIPLAIRRPDLTITLLESLLRRVNFLELAVAELGLTDRVRVVRGRAEEHRERYDVVTARAVATLPRLVSWCAPLMKPAGTLIALKGSTAPDELTDAADALRKARLSGHVHELPVPGQTDITWAIELRHTDAP